ncbi:MAG: hypothetical protein JW785_01705 [Acidimicrobiia bacterium]|nr:hypothetical protein [Acidimicrobiia bacterium]
MGARRGFGVGRMRWSIGPIVGAALVLAMAWALGLRGEPPPPQATTTAAGLPIPDPTTTLPLDPAAGRVDLMGVVIAVEAGPGWDTAPTGDCPHPAEGPRFDQCPRLGPATLVLADGARLDLPADSPGDAALWEMAQTGAPGFVIAGLQQEGAPAWVRVMPSEPPAAQIGLTTGPIVGITTDGWATTASGWMFHLNGILHTAGCAHLQPWTLAGPPASRAADWMARTELLDLWDGPQGTRLDLALDSDDTVRTVNAITCTDLLGQRSDPDPAATLAAARALWATQGPADYRLRYSGGSPRGGEGTWDITVLGDEVTAEMVESPTGFYQYPPYYPFRPPTVDDLLDRVETALTTPGIGCSADSHFSATYDPDRGHPTSFAYDSPSCLDEERSWEVAWLEPRYEGFPLCAGWDAIDPRTGALAHYSPHPVWPGGDWLEIGHTWRYEITIDGCGFPFVRFNERWWQQVERTYTPGTTGDGPGLAAGFAAHVYPADWEVCILPLHGGPLVQIYGHVTRVDTDTIEAATLDGQLIAVYAPTQEEPPYCTE